MKACLLRNSNLFFLETSLNFVLAVIVMANKEHHNKNGVIVMVDATICKIPYRSSSQFISRSLFLAMLTGWKNTAGGAKFGDADSQALHCMHVSSNAG